MSDISIPSHWQWFPEGRFGLFIHWGPYAQTARGEQVLFREHLDQQEYARQACAWAPRFFDAGIFRSRGFADQVAAFLKTKES